MPLTEVQANVLLHTDTGLRVVYIPAVPKVEVHPVAGGHYEFRQPDSDPAAVWRAIREHAVPLPVVTPSSQLALSLHRDLLAVIHGDGGHHADEHGLVESTRRAIEMVRRMQEPKASAGGIKLPSETDGGWRPPIDPDAPRRFRYRRRFENAPAGWEYGIYWSRSDRYACEYTGFGIGRPDKDRMLSSIEWIDPEPSPIDPGCDGRDHHEPAIGPVS